MEPPPKEVFTDMGTTFTATNIGSTQDSYGHPKNSQTATNDDREGRNVFEYHFGPVVQVGRVLLIRLLLQQIRPQKGTERYSFRLRRQGVKYWFFLVNHG